MKRNFLITVCVFQIFLLVMMIVSINYNIYQSDILPFVSAETFSCCEKTNDGAICQDVLSNYENCAADIVPTKCSSYSECQIGCCIDDEEGLCTTMSPRAKCEENRGIWKNEKNCNLLECQKDCCVLGNEVQFITEKRCELLSLIFGFEKDFRNFGTEYECLALKANQIEGACVFENGICKFGTKSECIRLGGKFSEGNLCSKESLNTTCEKQSSIRCIDGKDEIYWFDSCGNKENIYSSDKDASWNDGKVLIKSESCGAGNSNTNSVDCGNCNYYLGSICSESSLLEKGVKDGNFICENLNCIDENGNERLNGESWCVYDSFIGDGKDTVGSRHWKRMCIDGKIKVDPCADYRGQICVQAKIEGGDGKSFTTAACVLNEATKCLNYNLRQDMKACKENEYCVVKKINIDSDFKFDVCVGAYPKGFDLTREEYIESQNICSMASQKCEVRYVKNWRGKWGCKNNCNCENSAFSEQMNDLCISLGDCGSYVNYLGDGTNNAVVENAPGVSWEDYKKYAEVNKSQFAKPNSIPQILKAITGNSGGANLEEQEASSFEKGAMLLGTISFATGTLISAGMVIGEAFPSLVIIELSESAATTLGSISAAASGIGIGLMIGSLAAKAFGIQGDAATALVIAGGVAGGVAGLGATGALGTTMTSFSTFGGLFGPMLATMIWAAIAVAVIVTIIELIGWGDTKIVVVKFECQPWEAPLGNKNCEKCNDDPLKPCSKYRCESLGQACKLLNKDTENPICEGITNDGKPPIITIGNIIENFEFSGTSDFKTELKEKGKKCITEFTPVVFSLNTDEYAQCKYSFERTQDYGGMNQFPIEQNMFSENHTFAFSIPSVDSVHTYNIVGNLIEMYSDMNMYVRCQDYHGNYNSKEYIVHFCINDGPDLTPPKVVATNPKNNNYLTYGTTESNLDIYINEPAECRIDSNDRTYEQMRKNMVCDTDLLHYTDFGWKCSTTLYDLKNEENNFYIRCKDQPWMLNDTTAEFNEATNKITYKMRNANQESFVFDLFGSESELNINSIEPSGEIFRGFEPVTINLNARTSGGAENGEASCYYKFSEKGENILFSDTYSNLHNQEFNSMMSGDYEIFIECEDNAGNIAKNKTNFEIIVDSDAPKVVRAYNKNGKLILITDEDAECYYDFERCNFNEANATAMSATFTKEHSADFVSGQTYHIKCGDIWGNKGEGCTIKIRKW